MIRLQFVWFQLRYLQTLNSISAENNSTIVFPVPIDVISAVMGGGRQQNPMMMVCLSQPKYKEIFSLTDFQMPQPAASMPEQGQPGTLHSSVLQ